MEKDLKSKPIHASSYQEIREIVTQMHENNISVEKYLYTKIYGILVKKLGQVRNFQYIKSIVESKTPSNKPMVLSNDNKKLTTNQKLRIKKVTSNI